MRLRKWRKTKKKEKRKEKHCPISHYGTEESESLRPFRIAEKTMISSPLNKLSLSQTRTHTHTLTHINTYTHTHTRTHIYKYKQTNTHFQGDHLVK